MPYITHIYIHYAPPSLSLRYFAAIPFYYKLQCPLIGDFSAANFHWLSGLPYKTVIFIQN